MNIETNVENIQRVTVTENIGNMIRMLLVKKWFILKITAIFTIAGLVVALSIPREYTCMVKMAPETTGTIEYSNMSDFAAIAGIDLNLQKEDGINIFLYPDVIRSVPFLTEILNMHIEGVNGQNGYTFYNYLDNDINKPWWSSAFEAVFRLIDRIRFGKPENVDGVIDNYQLTRRQDDILNMLNDRIYTNVDKKTGVFYFSITLQDPVLSASVADTVIKRLERYIINYRTRKAKHDLDFVVGMAAEAQSRYYSAQQNYAQYVDRNKNIVLESVQIEQNRLKNELNLAFDVYSGLAQQVENAKIKVQEKTPGFTIFEPARVPARKSNTSRLMILMGYMLTGMIIGILAVINVDLIRSLKSSILKDEA